MDGGSWWVRVNGADLWFRSLADARSGVCTPCLLRHCRRHHSPPSAPFVQIHHAIRCRGVPAPVPPCKVVQSVHDVDIEEIEPVGTVQGELREGNMLDRWF